MRHFATALATAALVTVTPVLAQDQPLRIVFQGGKSLPIEALQIQDKQFVVVVAQDTFTQGQKFPITVADHMFGDKPPAVNQGIALLLMDDPVKALGLLEPVLVSQKVTATVPGNFWVEAARATILAYASMGNRAKVDVLGKELAEATPAAGADPVMELAAALMQPSAGKPEAKAAPFNLLINDATPPEVAGYAAYFKAAMLKKAKRDTEALESFLVAPCLYPTGSNVLNGASELMAADYILRQPKRHEEAQGLLASAARNAKGTAIGDEAKKRLESSK